MARWRNLPGFDRRRAPRSQAEHTLSRRLHLVTGAFWALCGLGVVVYLALAAAGAFRPNEVIWLTALVAILAIISLAHAALVLYRAGPGAQRTEPEEER